MDGYEVLAIFMFFFALAILCIVGIWKIEDKL